MNGILSCFFPLKTRVRVMQLKKKLREVVSVSEGVAYQKLFKEDREFNQSKVRQDLFAYRSIYRPDCSLQSACVSSMSQS